MARGASPSRSESSEAARLERISPESSLSPPPGTTELGIDIIQVSRIKATLARFGRRFSRRVLTESEDRYVRDRPETFMAVALNFLARRP